MKNSLKSVNSGISKHVGKLASLGPALVFSHLELVEHVALVPHLA